MRASKILKYVICTSFCLSSFSCIKTDDFEMPQPEAEEVLVEGHITGIAAVKSNFDIEKNEIYTFQESGVYMEGYVISSDEAGNFYKELILQDKPTNPTAGIQVLVDENTLFETYEFGSKIYVYLEGLSLWYNNGVLQLGKQNRGDVEAIPRSLVDEHLVRTTERATVEPLELNIEDFREEFKNLYIRLRNVQFNRNLVRENLHFTFAGEVIDEYDGVRQVESCSNSASTALSTSTFADFKSLLLPKGSGNIEGVLSRDFYDDFYVVVINTTEALIFDEERCDSSFLKCGQNTARGTEVLFEENFSDVTNEDVLEGRGWTNMSVFGEERFEDGTYDGDRYIRISAYGTDESPMEAWLVSPAVDLDRTREEVLFFDIMASYDNATILSVYVTTDYTGNPLTTEWLPVDAIIPVGPTNQYGRGYIRSAIDISCLDGAMHFAFRYLGGVPDKTTTYDIDNIRITGN